MEQPHAMILKNSLYNQIYIIIVNWEKGKKFKSNPN